MLAAAGDGGEPEALARRLADRLRLGVVAEEELVDLVTDRGLMRAAATRLEGLDEEPVLQLAGHLATPERTRALYVLSLALGELETWERDRLDELVSRVLGVLSRPELTGARGRLGRRAAPGRGAPPRRGRPRRDHAGRCARRARISSRTTPPTSPVTPPCSTRFHGRGASARSRSRSRPTRPASRSRRATGPGLLAAVSGVLAARGLDVVDASAADVAGRRRGRVVPRSHTRARIGRRWPGWPTSRTRSVRR